MRLRDLMRSAVGVRQTLVALGIAGLALVAACSGGSPNANYPAPLVGSGSLTSGLAITMPSTSGLAVGTVTLNGSGTVSATQSTTNPTGTAVLTSKQRQSIPTGQTPAAYVTITASGAVTLSSVTIAVAPQPPVTGGTYSLAYWNGSQWVSYLNSAGTSPLTATPAPGGVITVSSGNLKSPISLAAGSSMYFAVYTGGGTFTTPTPEPAPPVASPASVTLGEGAEQIVSVTTNPGLAITASSSNTSLVTVSPSPSATANSSGVASFTLVAQDQTGTATVTFTDPIGHSTQTQVTVNDVAPTPSPLPGAPTLGLGDEAVIQITAAAGSTVTVTSGTASVAPVAAGGTGTPPPSPTAPTTFSGTTTVTATNPGGTTGYAYIWVQGLAGGTSSITLEDQYQNKASFTVVVSAIRNGSFTNGLTGWTPCTYAHPSQSSGVNATEIVGSTSADAPYATVQGPQIGATAAPPLVQSPAPTSTPLSNFVTLVPSPLPNNDNPGYPNSGSVGITLSGLASGATTGYTIDTPGVAPAVLGADVVLLGNLNSYTNPNAAGAFGMCQTITVPATAPYLSMYVLEGGEYYKATENDQEVAIFPSSTLTSGYIATGTPSYLFLEWNCYLDESYLGWGTGESGSNSCLNTDTASGSNWYLGGFWQPRGPYNLSSYAGQTVTLYVGVWSYYANSGSSDAKYAQFMYVGNVQMTTNGTGIPSAAPLSRQHRVLGTVQLATRSSGTIQSTRIRKP
jgi:hypothetical protein